MESQPRVNNFQGHLINKGMAVNVDGVDTELEIVSPT